MSIDGGLPVLPESAQRFSRLVTFLPSVHDVSVVDRGALAALGRSKITAEVSVLVLDMNHEKKHGRHARYRLIVSTKIIEFLGSSVETEQVVQSFRLRPKGKSYLNHFKSMFGSERHSYSFEGSLDHATSSSLRRPTLNPGTEGKHGRDHTYSMTYGYRDDTTGSEVFCHYAILTLYFSIALILALLVAKGLLFVAELVLLLLGFEEEEEAKMPHYEPLATKAAHELPDYKDDSSISAPAYEESLTPEYIA